MKVIFLDIDGVLNTPKLLQKFGWNFIDDILVALLARIVRETDSKIVLSSTWRIEEHDKKLVAQALSRHGLEIFDVTPVINKTVNSASWDNWVNASEAVRDSWVKRSDEIQAWLDGASVDKFAILDDVADAHIEGSFFQTDEKRGLTVEIAEKVIQHLA